MPELWPHQQRGLHEARERLTPGATTCITSPTGMGKTTMMVELLKLGVRAVLYTNRRMLLDQTANVLAREGLSFGVRAAGHDENRGEAIQISSLQTEDARVFKSGRWGDLHQADLVLIDEAHANKEGVAEAVIRRHQEAGAAVIGFTATPLDIGHLYDNLIVAGTVSEGRACGALVPAHTYGPDEPDLRKIKRTKTGEFKQADIVKAVMTQSIFGRVVEHWRALNPDQRPTLLFAPGVAESLWFAEELTKEGIPAAHIDGNDVWVNGKFFKSDQAARDELRQLSEDGRIRIVCNRFVMREGIDWPHLYHGIFATVFGALTSFLQSGGRLLRAHPSMDHVIIQDHGGNWWRHGSLNSDREWALDRTAYMVSEAREERLRTKKEPEPIHCPKCHAIRLSGPVCHTCGFQSHNRSRFVVQHDGKLREMTGDIFRRRREDKRPDVAKIWRDYYYRGRNADMTFNQIRGLYAYENNWQWPPAGLPLMPKEELDWFRSAKTVPYDRLYGNNLDGSPPPSAGNDAQPSAAVSHTEQCARGYPG